MGPYELLPNPYWSIDWLDPEQDLYRQPQLLLAHECNGPVMSKFFKITFIYLFVWQWVEGEAGDTHATECTEVRGQLAGVESLLHDVGSRDHIWIVMPCASAFTH